MQARTADRRFALCYYVIMFPIRPPYRVGYRHGQRTFYNAAHIGIDLLVPEMTPGYAEEDGVINTFFGREGGQWMSLTNPRGNVHRHAHIKQYVAKKGQQVKKGQLIFYTGGIKGAWYSGNSTDPHVHWDIMVEGKFVDPEDYSTVETLDDVRKSINGHFLNIFKRQPVKEDNDYFLSRIGQLPPVGINSSVQLIDKMKYWAAQTLAKWLAERKKVLGV